MANDIQMDIYITEELETELNNMKWRHYKERTQNDMICDIIIKGLEAAEKNTETCEFPKQSA